VHAADLARQGRLAREAAREHAEVAGGAADVDDYGVARAGEERGAPDRVGGAGADREHGVARRVVDGHQGAVVLREEGVGVEALLGDDRQEGAGHLARDAAERGVEHGRVLAFEQAERADLVAEREGHLADVSAHEVAHLELLLGERGREDAAHGDRVEAAVEGVEEAADGVGVERRDREAVDEVAAARDRGAREHRVAELGRPARQRRELGRGGRAEPDDGDAVEVAAAHDGVRRVGRAEHDARDEGTTVAELPQHGDERRADAARDIGRGGLLGPGEHPAGAVERDGVGVGAADVDADREVAGGHRAASAVARAKGT